MTSNAIPTLCGARRLPAELLAAGAVAGMLAMASVAAAQGGFAMGVADPFAIDAANQAAGGGGLNASPFLNRANAVAADPFGGGGNPFAPVGDPFGGGAIADPFGGGAVADPFGAGGFPPAGGFPAAGGFAGGGFPAAGGFAGGGFPAAGGFAGGGLAPGSGPAFAPPPPTVRAIYGQRITCAVTNRLIADASVVRVLQSEVAANYADDGKTNMDSVANDNIFTNVTDSKGEFISPEAHLLKTRVIAALRYAVDRRPNEFFLTVDVASTDPLADDRVPQYLDLETERDGYLTAWSERFLTAYRKSPDGDSWEFLPTYLPPPPLPPTTSDGFPIDIPANFIPPDRKFLQRINPAAGGGAGGGLVPGAAGASREAGGGAI